MDWGMRKAEREITDFGEKVALLARCDTIRLGLRGDEFPYVVPLSFGFEVKGESIIIYFHCAKEGKKAELIKADPRICVEADILNGYRDTGKSVTADYESIIGFGLCKEVFGEEAVHGLDLLLEHCKVVNRSARQCASLNVTAVYKIELLTFTGKRRFQ